VEENLLSWPQIRSLDQRLAGGQADQGDGRRFFHRERAGLDRHVIFVDGDQLREGADSPVSGPRIDFVARLESTLARSDPHLVDSSGVDLDQYVILPQLGLRHLAGPHVVGAPVPIEDERLHVAPATCRSSPFGSAKKAGPVPWLIASG
jgi:hypothetical protein